MKKGTTPHLKGAASVFGRSGADKKSPAAVFSTIEAVVIRRR
jgi:hypothetical protein